MENDYNKPSYLAGILTGLRTYTIGSCNYWFCHKCSDNSEEDIQLQTLTTRLCVEEDKLHGDKEEKEWKRLACRADVEMKKRLRYHFKSHIEKWTDEDRRRFPWKLTLHVLLLIIVTTQVSLYAIDKMEVTSFVAENVKVFGDSFIISDSKDKPVKELFKLSQVYSQITHVVEAYYNFLEESVNPFNYTYGETSTRNASNLTMTIEYAEYEDCFDKVNDRDTFPITSDHVICHRNLFVETVADLELADEICTNKSECCSMEYCDRTVRNQVEYFINKYNSYRIQQVKFKFSFNTFYQKGIVERDRSINALYHVTIVMENKIQRGHVDVDLRIDHKLERHCGSTLRRGTVLDVIVLIFAIIILKFYIFSLVKLIKLLKDMRLHFLAYHKKLVSYSDLCALVNSWYLMTLFACLLIKTSIVLKIVSDYKERISFHMIEAVSIMLGSGMFLLWCGLFGFLKYFESLNVLLITVKLALPSILRFAVCMFILFMAFMFCGWLVIGPYNPQFKNPLTTAENLISFLNGEGIGIAFETVSWDDPFVSIAVSVFNKIYLILFIFIFIYIVLSLFIGIFDQAYDSLSGNWKERSRGFVQDWAEGEPDNDLTKSYPFPVPRIREIPVEFDSFTSIDESNQTLAMSNQNNESQLQHLEDASPDVVISNDSDINNVYSGRTLSPYNSLPAHLPYQLHVPQQTQRRVHSQFGYPTDHTTCKYCGSRPGQSNSSSGVKSTARKPPNASQRDVARARSIIQYKNSMRQEEMLGESDI